MFLTFWAHRASKVANWKRIIVLEAFSFFLVWGGDAPNPFRDIPFYSMSLHSAGLPGRVKRNSDNALLSEFRFTGCNWKPSATLGHARGNLF
jgi:hypothetical protein